MKRVRTLDIEFKVVGKPFVDKAPTERFFKLIEHSPTRIILRVLTRTHDIPYCDTFGVDEEWYIASPTPASKCCVLRIAYKCDFYKFSMLKSVIKSGAESDTAKVWNEFKDTLTAKGIDFVEKKRPPPQIVKRSTSPALIKEKAVEDKEDYTTEAELNSLFDQQPVGRGKEATEYVKLLIGMNVEEFYKTYLQEDAEKCLLKFYASRGERIIGSTPWSDPVTDEDKVYEKLNIIKMRTMDVSF